MSAPSAEHAKAHAEAAKAAPGSKPSEGGHVVDGSLFDILSQLKDNLIATAAVPAAVYEHQHSKGGDHPKADHPKKEGEAKKAEGGDHPKPHDDALAKHKKEEMHGDAVSLAMTIPAAYKAWKAGNLETEDIAHVIDPLVDMTSTSPWLRMLVRPMAIGTKWLLNWGFGANEHVHETDPVFEKLGKQIMGFAQDKDGRYHHACEGLVAGLKGEKDLEPLQLHFADFHEKAQFDDAVKKDKPGLRKSIASLLGSDKKLNETQVRSLITTLMHRLEGHGAGTPPTATITPHHQLRPALRTKHLALLKLYENAFNWLDQAELDKIYDDTAPEKDFKIDFETFGDLLLEQVTPDNRDRYLRGINEKTFKNTFKGKFAYLTAATTLKAAMKKPEEKAKVIAQLKKFLGLEELPPMDLAALKDKITTLRERVSGDPENKPTDPTMLLKYGAFIESLALVEAAFTDEVLDELFDGEKAPEKPIDYSNIGHEIFKRTKTPADLRIFEKQYDENEMFLPYGPLLSKENMLAEATANPDNLKLLLGKLFAISGTLTNDKIIKQTTDLTAGLRRVTDGSTPKLHDLANKIESVKDDVIKNHLLTPRLKYNAIGADILARVHTAADVDTLNGAMSMVDVELAVGSLFNKDTLEEEIETDLPSAQAKIRNLFGITGAVTRAGVIRQGRAIEAALGLQTPIPLRIGVLLFNIEKAHDLLTGAWTPPVDAKILAKLYGKEAPAATVVNAESDKFAAEFPELDAKEVPSYILGYSTAAFQGDFNYLFELAELNELVDNGTDAEKDVARAQVRKFANQGEGNITRKRIETIVGIYERQLATAEAQALSATPQFIELSADIAAIKANLQESVLKKLFKVTTPEVKGVINYAQLGSAIMALDEPKKLTQFKASADLAQVNELYEPLATVRGLEDLIAKDPGEAHSKLLALFGLENGVVTIDRLTKRRSILNTRLGLLGTLSRTGDALHQIAVLLFDVLETLKASPSAQTALATLNDRTWAIGYPHFADYIASNVRSNPDKDSFLRAYSDDALRGNFLGLFPVTNIDALVARPADRGQVRDEVVALLGLKGRITIQTIEGRRKALEKQLEGTTEVAKFKELKDTLEELINAIKPHITALFDNREEVVVLNEWGRQFDGLNEEDDVVAFLRGYVKADRQFNAMFKELMDANAFDKAVNNDRQRELIIGKLYVLLGLNSAVVNIEYKDIEAALDEQMAKLGPEGALPDAVTKAQHQKILRNLTAIKTLFANKKRMEQLFKGVEVVPNYNALGSQIRSLQSSPAKLVGLLKGLAVNKMTRFIGLRGLKTGLGAQEAVKVEPLLRSLLGVDDGEQLTPENLAILAQDIQSRLSIAEIRQDGEAYANANSLVETLRAIREADLRPFFAQLQMREMMKSEEGRAIANLQVRSLERGLRQDQWGIIQNSLTQEVVNRLVELEREGGEPAFTGLDVDGNLMLTETSQEVVSSTVGMSWREAVREAGRRGYDLLTIEEYMAIQRIKPMDQRTQTWLKQPIDADRNTICGELSGKDGQHISVASAETVSPRRGYRRVLRLPRRTR